MIQILVRSRFEGAPLEFVVVDDASSHPVPFDELAEHLRVRYRAKPKLVKEAIAGALEYFARARYERGILENKIEQLN